MKNRLLIWMTMLIVFIATVIGGSSAVFAEDNDTVGSLQWCYYVGDYNAKDVQTPPVYYNGYVYTVTQHDGNSYLQRIKEKVSVGKDKKVKNEQIETLAELKGKIIEYATIAPTVDASAGKIYIPLTGCFAIVSIEGGNPVYVDTDGIYAAGGRQTVSPIIYDSEYIYAGTWGGSSLNSYYRISKSDFTKTVMKEDTGFYWAGACSITLDDGTGVIFGSDSGNVYLYSNKSNSVIDTLKVGGKVRSSVVSDGKGNYYFSVYEKYDSGYLYKVSVKDGKLVVADNYPVTLSGGSTCTPVISDGNIYVGTDKSTIDIFDESGKKLSSAASPGTVKSLVEIKGNIYAPDNALSGNKGGIIRTDGSSFFMPDESMQQSNIYQIAGNDDGTMLFFKNDSGYLMAINIEKKSDTGDDNEESAVPDDGDETGTADVFVTVTSKGTVKVAQENVKVKDIDNDGKLTVNDALYIAHENFYEGGAAAGYDSSFGEYGLSLNKLWGDDSGCFGYRVNNKSALSLEDTVKKGDYVNAYIYKDQVGYSDLYTWFDKNFLSVKSGEQFTLSLYAAGYDDQWNEVVNPVSNADITINGESIDCSTNESGKVTFSIPEKGEYIISAESKTENIVAPVCKVSVSDGAAVINQDNKNAGDKSTQTGDDFNIVAIVIIALAALSAAAIIFKRQKIR